MSPKYTPLMSLRQLAQASCLALGLFSAALRAQTSASVLMLSDIHFEAFADPAKLPQLRESPIEQWPAIFSSPASATQAADFAALQKACPVHGLDTAWPLLSTSLKQAAAQQPHPLFVTVSGDLMGHEFDCRFRNLVSKTTEEEVSAFAAKTVAFVVAQLHTAFPGSPLYLALGNNDSGCPDYLEDRNSAFLQQVAPVFAQAAGGLNGQTILREFSDEGDYSIALPQPMQNARLIVLQDIFDSSHYKGCNGKPDAGAAGAAQLTWLHAQLADARAHHQHVWVMAHVPPGVEMYSTVSRHLNVCSGQPPAMFLSSEKLAETLTAFPEVVALAIFAHSHADELRWLHAPGSQNAVPAKLVSSISPVNGNQPTFTVAQVDTRTAQMLDDTVYLVGTGNNATGATREYSFRETYKLPAYSAAALQTLTAGFLADTTGSSPGSQAYQHLYFPGDTGLHALAMQLFWRAYACSLREDDPAAYRTCACPANPEHSK